MKRWNQLMVALVAGALGLVFTIAAAQNSPKDGRLDDPLRQAQSDLTSGRLEKALEHCRKAIELNPEYLEARVQMAMLLLHNHEDGEAAREFGVRSPLDEVDLTKDEIRELSHRAGLPTWDEPASACLSSRIPYHTEVTDEKLRTIERAEQALRALGFRVFRVRHHDDLARIEIARGEMARALEPETSAAIVRDLKAAGYKYVSLDLQGYRMGSLNEGLFLRPT